MILLIQDRHPVARGFIPAGLRSSPFEQPPQAFRKCTSAGLRLLRSRAGINPLATMGARQNIRVG